MSAKDQKLSFFGPDIFSIGQANRGREQKVFDWVKAANLIKNHPDFPNIQCEAGLAGDFEYTGGIIFDGKIVEDDYTYLASTWATPTLIIDGEEHDCYVMENFTEWNEARSGQKRPKVLLTVSLNC